MPAANEPPELVVVQNPVDTAVANVDDTQAAVADDARAAVHEFIEELEDAVPELEKDKAKRALNKLLDKLLDARAGTAAEGFATTIKQTATSIVEHFSETPMNWCVVY